MTVLAVAAPAHAQTEPAEAAAPAVAAPVPEVPPPPAPPKPKVVRVTIATSLGPVIAELEVERAPVTAANFLRYVDQKRYDGAVFYRAMNIAPGYGVVQGGVRGDPKKVLKVIPHEPTSKTGLSHVDGALSMARLAPGTANAEFFITIGTLTAFDADPSKPGDNLGYAVFGRVVQGMETVKAILAAPTSPTDGAGVMKGQMIAKPVVMTSVRRGG